MYKYMCVMCSYFLSNGISISLEEWLILSKNEYILSFKKDFYLFFRERGKEGERGREHQCVVASRAPPTGELASNPGMCWESNLRPFDFKAGTQSTEPHQPWLM